MTGFGLSCARRSDFILGLAQGNPGGGTTNPAPTGYVGPPPLTAIPPPPIPYDQIPTAGDAVEIDSGKYLRIDNVHVTNGGIGPGNAVFHCGIDESDPAMFLGGNAVGSIVLTDSRFDGNQTFSGATNPDFSMRLGNSCHDSIYRAVTAFDGTKADILEYNGNLFSQIHLNSDAGNSNTGLADPMLAFTVGLNSEFAGVADYGVYVIGNTSLSQTQCDIANLACVYVVANLGVSGTVGTSLYNPGQITDTQMKCGSLQSVSPAYMGVELSNGVVNTTVSGTAASGKCKVPAAQLVVLDGLASPPPSVDPSVSLCNNSNASPLFCGGYQNGFAGGRFYTQPSLAYTTGSGVALIAHTLYAAPFITATGGTISQLGIEATAAGAATQCRLGIYATVAGAPGALLLDTGPGTLPMTFPNPLSFTGLNFLLQPNTLYFLAIGCNGTAFVQGASTTNGLAGLLLGEANFSTYGGTAVTGSWSFGPLPGVFPTPVFTTTPTAAPNVYVGS